jgi:glucose-6-phosphate 1-dehydrogenase
MGSRREPAEPHLFIVLGGSGDLMQRKLLPALWRLADQGLVGAPSRVLGVARRAQFDDESYRVWAREALAEAGLPPDPEADRWCDECLHYHSLGDQTPEDYAALACQIEELERAHDLPGNRVLYLAVPPQVLVPTIEQLGRAGLNESPGWTRLVIEKPFGEDYDSAVELDRDLKQHFDETQVYRIDHYLGKEAVQNLLVFRFANPIFESVWNRDRVASVQITVAEREGAEGRATYYDGTGVVRDMMQNHLLQLLALTAMESPTALQADAVRDEKAKVLRSLRALDARDVVLGQYTAGEVDGEPAAGYLADEQVPDDSRTPTFAALQAHVDNWRWHGVPFFLRTGKRLPANTRQIIVNFRCPVLAMFRHFPEAQIVANSLIITIEPNEGFELLFEVKAPGELLTLQTQRLKFRYDDAFDRLPEAYEALLLDLMYGDQTLFVRIDEVLEAWRVVAPLLSEDLPVHPYAAGTWGPAEAERLTVPAGAACVL